MRILIVEDDFFSRKLLMGYLKPYGDLDVTVNGVEALVAVKEALGNNQHYDLICLDIMMPEMDGQQALKHIRQLEERAGLTEEQGVKVFMTTALSDKETVLQAAQSRCDAFLIKPLRFDKVQEALAEQGFRKHGET